MLLVADASMEARRVDSNRVTKGAADMCNFPEVVYHWVSLLGGSWLECLGSWILLLVITLGSFAIGFKIGAGIALLLLLIFEPPIRKILKWKHRPSEPK